MERGERILPPSPLCFHHAGQPQRPPSHFRLSLLLLSEHGTFSESQSYYPSPASWRGDKSSPAPWKRGSAEPLFLAPAVGLAMTITLLQRFRNNFICDFDFGRNMCERLLKNDEPVVKRFSHRLCLYLYYNRDKSGSKQPAVKRGLSVNNKNKRRVLVVLRFTLSLSR